MATSQMESLSALYERDETAWLEAMSELAARRLYAEMDYPHLSEYLADMAKRDRRETFSRLVALMHHLLKWERQPEKRSGSWRATIIEQRQEMQQIVESGTLRNHARSVLPKAYAAARKRAAADTELPLDVFPEACPWGLETLLSEEG